MVLIFPLLKLICSTSFDDEYYKTFYPVEKHAFIAGVLIFYKLESAKFEILSSYIAENNDENVNFYKPSTTHSFETAADSDLFYDMLADLLIIGLKKYSEFNKPLSKIEEQDYQKIQKMFPLDKNKEWFDMAMSLSCIKALIMKVNDKNILDSTNITSLSSVKQLCASHFPYIFDFDLYLHFYSMISSRINSYRSLVYFSLCTMDNKTKKSEGFRIIYTPLNIEDPIRAVVDKDKQYHIPNSHEFIIIGIIIVAILFLFAAFYFKFSIPPNYEKTTATD
ncbi:hypothetical protein NUSPORA_00545 [Nucleospora cyclopteri]